MLPHYPAFLLTSFFSCISISSRERIISISQVRPPARIIRITAVVPDPTALPVRRTARNMITPMHRYRKNGRIHRTSGSCLLTARICTSVTDSSATTVAAEAPAASNRGTPRSRRRYTWPLSHLTACSGDGTPNPSLRGQACLGPVLRIPAPPRAKSLPLRTPGWRPWPL